MTRAWTLAWLLALACACQQADDLTQTVVWIDGDDAVRSELKHVTVQAVGPMDNREPSVESQNSWPIKLVFAPKNGDASRHFTLHIEARGATDSQVLKLRFETGFVADQSRFALLWIRDACLARPTARCSGAACDTWELSAEARTLGLSGEAPLRIDASCDPTQPRSPSADGTAGASAKPDKTATAGSSAGPDAGLPSIDAGASNTAGGGAAPSVDPMSTGPGGTCDPGHARTGQGGVCEDIDECQIDAPCGEHGECQNTQGSYTCLCAEGFDGSTGTCLDIDECQQADHGCEGGCVNSVGSYTCECAAGTWIKADRKACGQFSDAQRMGLLGSVDPTYPSFAFDGEGNGLAVWTQSDGTKKSILTRRYSATDGWAPAASPLEIPAEGNPGVASLALDAGGRGALVWLQTIDDHSDVWAARYAAARFSTPTKISRDDAGTAYLGAIVDLVDGAGFAVWSQSDGTHARVWANHLSASGWAGARPIRIDSSDDAFGARLAIGPGGHASLVWTELTLTDSTISRATAWGTRLEAGSLRWGSPTQLDDSDFAGMPDTDLYAPDGTGLNVWVHIADQRASVWARSEMAGAAPGSSTDITGSTSPLTWVAPRVALSPTGSGAAIWSQGEMSANQVWANRYEGATGTWATAARLSDVDSSGAPSPMIAVDPSGDGIAVWSEIVGTARVVQARRLQAGVGWLEGVALSKDVVSESTPSSPVHIAVDARGNAMATWDVLEGGRYFVRASKFE